MLSKLNLRESYQDLNIGSTALSSQLPLQSSTLSELSDPIQTNFRLYGSSLINEPGSGADPGNTLATARNLGTINSTQTITEFVGSNDTNDYYLINLGANSNLNLSLTGLSADVDVQLLNSNGTSIAYSNRIGNPDEAINLSSLAAGNYYVRVYQYSGNSNYTLRLSNTKPSNLLPTENNLGTLSGFRTFGGNISNNNTAETYRFSLSSTSNDFNITLSGLSADADVRLIRDANSNGVIDTGEEITGSRNGSNNPELIRRALGAGNYFVQVFQYNGSTNYHLSISTGDWYSRNLSDAGIIGEARYASADGQFSRNEMLSILRETKDYGSIDSTELTNLRTLYNGVGYMMPEHVRVLTNKVINSDPANTRSGIGNLAAGSTSDTMERLIGKWFLGNDRPTASGTYQYISGSLFQNGASFTDVRQGSADDCYLLAGLAETAFRSNSTISSGMFIDNGDNTYTVRFYNNGVADYVTVDRYLPTNSSGYSIYASWGGGQYNSSSNELWVALAEKAYAQINQSGWINQDNTNTYVGINNGWPYDSMKHITGRATRHDSINLNNIISAFNSGRMVALNTNVSGVAAGLVNNHSYAMLGYNATTDRFRLYNPHGYENELTRQQIIDNFRNWDSTTA
jgi:hypothetical protein